MSTQALTQQDLEFQAGLYDDPNPTRRWLHNTRRNWVLDALDRYTPKRNESVLEIGVGCGTYTRHLSHRGCNVTAIDVNQTFLNAVALLPGVAAYRADAASLLPLRGYDVALCTEVLEHIEPSRSKRLMRNVYNALKLGGRLVLTTPQPYSTAEIMARLLRFRPLRALAKRVYGNVDELGHINLIAHHQLTRELRNIGFEVVETTGRGLYIPLVAEFCGRPGQAVQAAFERNFRNAPQLRRLLWTQCYVLKKLAK